MVKYGQEFISQQQVGMQQPGRSHQMTQPYGKHLRGYPVPSQYGLAKPAEEARSFRMYHANQEQPDEFHHNDNVRERFSHYLE